MKGFHIFIRLMVLAGVLFSSSATADYVKGCTALQATVDFEAITKGKVPYYKDKHRRALAINAANPIFRAAWARAETSFKGKDNTYDIRITTLTEVGGECSYRVLINGQVVGTFTNPETDKKYSCVEHVWPGVSVKKGDRIAVESKAATNGKVPERGGTAWARGRWRGLEFIPAK